MFQGASLSDDGQVSLVGHECVKIAHDLPNCGGSMSSGRTGLRRSWSLLGRQLRKSTAKDLNVEIGPADGLKVERSMFVVM